MIQILQTFAPFLLMLVHETVRVQFAALYSAGEVMQQGCDPPNKKDNCVQLVAVAVYGVISLIPVLQYDRLVRPDFFTCPVVRSHT